jgi:LPXTG-motif cell wall-anchored protein
VTHRITRSDVRKATIYGLRRTKADPHSLRLTPGQVRHIVEQAERPRRRLRLALWTAALALCLLLLSASPALADYSDHGEPQTSLVASTHPQTYTPSGGLPRTGADTEWLSVLGVLLVASGVAVVLASSKRARP